MGMKYRSNRSGEKQSVSQHLCFHGTQQLLNMPSSRHTDKNAPGFFWTLLNYNVHEEFVMHVLWFPLGKIKYNPNIENCP